MKGKRIAILAENLYQEMELWVPYYRMREEGAEVKVVGADGARSYAQRFTPARIAARYASVYRSLVAAADSPAVRPAA